MRMKCFSPPVARSSAAFPKGTSQDSRQMVDQMHRESAELQRSFEATMQSPKDLEGSVGLLLGFWADRS